MVAVVESTDSVIAFSTVVSISTPSVEAAMVVVGAAISPSVSNLGACSGTLVVESSRSSVSPSVMSPSVAKELELVW